MLRLAKDALIYGGGDFVLRLLSFAIFPVYAHLFSVADYGALELVGTAVSIILMISTCGLNSSIQRYYWDPTSTERTQRNLVTTGVTLQLLFGLLAVVSAGVLLWIFHQSLNQRYGISATVASLALATIPLTLVVQYAGDVLRLQFSPWKYSILSFMRNIAGVIASVVLVAGLGFGLDGVFLGSVIGLSLGLIVSFYLVPVLWKGRFDLENARSLCGYGYPLVFAGIAYWIFGSMDRWMLSEMSSMQETGLYSIAFKFSGILQLLLVAFGQAWSPFSIRLFRDRPDYRRVYGAVLSVWTFLLAAGTAAITLFASELLFFLTPAEYHAAAPIVGWCTAGVALYGTTQVTAVGISLEKKTHLLARAAWLVALINLVLNYLFIPHLGAIGAAVATFISYGVLTGLYIWWTQRLHPIELQLWPLAVGFILISLVAVLGTFLPVAGFRLDVFLVKVVAVLGLAIVILRSSKVRDLILEPNVGMAK